MEVAITIILLYAEAFTYGSFIFISIVKNILIERSGLLKKHPRQSLGCLYL